MGSKEERWRAEKVEVWCDYGIAEREGFTVTPSNLKVGLLECHRVRLDMLLVIELLLLIKLLLGHGRKRAEDLNRQLTNRSINNNRIYTLAVALSTMDQQIHICRSGFLAVLPGNQVHAHLV